MKITDTFVCVADDGKATQGVVPPLREGAPSLARLHYDLLAEHPYEYDIDSFNFEIYCQKNRIPPEHRDAHREAFFAKGHPCMRASPLTRAYGFGAHYNGAGKIAIYPMDSVAYHKLMNDPEVHLDMAMRNRRPVLTGVSAQGAGRNPSSRPKGLHSAA